MEQAIGALKDEKISLSLLGLVVAIAWWSYGWANEEFAKKQDVDDLKTLMVTHTEEFRIVNASQIIRDLELQLQLSEATNQDIGVINHLKEEIADAKQYRRCLVDRKPNCQYLKPPE